MSDFWETRRYLVIQWLKFKARKTDNDNKKEAFEEVIEFLEKERDNEVVDEEVFKKFVQNIEDNIE